MLRLAIPAVLVVAGIAGGAIAGLMMRPSTAETADTAVAKDEAAPDPAEYVQLTNQFIVPLLEDGHVVSMVVLSLGLEVEPGSENAVYAHEPKLRDEFLQVLFSHANNGGFQGAFTEAANLAVIRTALTEVASSVLPGLVRDVLINDITRQDG